ncbi:hypothetical protein SDC9_152163 [bioreactor metagenome]|uniref:Uncharacterized protein n=1 Tax=bioreactor metagenome TaxID=1076179 RepID=A0A645ESB8_9ZZZZ
MIPARLIPSPISANPPPEVVTSGRAPAYDAPTAIFTAAGSSSACSTATWKRSAFAERNVSTPVAGDIGYPAANEHPPATAPSATASDPSSRILFRSESIASWYSGSAFSRSSSPKRCPSEQASAFAFATACLPEKKRSISSRTRGNGTPVRPIITPAMTIAAYTFPPSSFVMSSSGI